MEILTIEIFTQYKTKASTALQNSTPVHLACKNWDGYFNRVSKRPRPIYRA